MTVVTTTTYTGPYTANGVTVAFPFTFSVADATEVQVTLNGVIVNPSLYTVSIGGGGTGTATFTVAPSSGQIYLYLNPAFDQEVNFEDQGPYLQSALNEPLDRAARRSIYLRGIALRALVAPLGEAGATMPTIALRKGKALGFDPVTGAPVAISADSFSASVDAAAARADRLLADADVLLTHADVLLTHADVATTGTVAASVLSSQAGAVAAAAMNGVFPNSAGVGGNIPKGAVSTNVTVGTGGTNATNVVATFTGGTLTYNPSILYDIVGGVISNVRTLFKGLFIGAGTPTMPTISNTGLGTNAITLTAGLLYAVGQTYWAVSADGRALDSIINTAGAPASNTAAVPSFLLKPAYDAQAAARIIAAVSSGFGDPSGIKFLMTKEGAKTYRAGSSTDIDTIAPLIGGGTLVQPAFSWNGSNGAAGAPLRAIETADGLQFGSQTGYNWAVSNIGNTTTICFDVFFKMPALKTTAAAPAGTYASVAAMTADTANLFEGDIVKVVGGPVTNLATDIPLAYIGGMSFTDDSQLTQGYYIKEATVLSRMDQQPLLVLEDSAIPGSKLVQIMFDRRGQLRVFFYDNGGTNFGVIRTTAKDALAMAQSRMCHLKLELDTNDGHVRIWLNGIESMAIKGVVPNFTPNLLLVNGGPTRGGNAIAPCSGQSWTCGAICITEGLDFTQRRLGSNALAKIFGTPEQAWSPYMNLIVVSGNSRGDGYTNPGGAGSVIPDPTSGWGFEIVRSQSNISDADNPSQTSLDRVYSPRNFLNPTDIAPVVRVADISGNLVANVSHLVSTAYGLESVEWGLFSELFKYREAKAQDWAIIGVCVGNTSVGELNKVSATRPYLFTLRGSTPDASAYRDLANRAVAEMIAFAKRRGQQLRLVAVYGEGGAKTTPIPTNLTPLAADLASGPFYTQAQYGAAYEASARQWINNELLPLCGPSDQQPIYIRISDPVAVTGTNDNALNIAPYYFDNQHRVLEANKDTAFRFVWAGEMYSIAWRTTHWPTITYKTIGARIGWTLGKALYTNADMTSLGVKSASIVSGKIRCFLTGPVAVVDTAPNSKPSILGRQTTGGVDTFGAVFEPNASSPGRTITAVDNTNIAAGTPYIEITISGGGAIAGDRISFTGATAFYTNYRSTTRVFASFNDQDWTVANNQTGQASAFAKKFTVSANPVEITPWLNVSSHVV